jgi:UDP-glucose:(heptosyl)LPS alpha-1,3-glucosyltransferase
VKFAFILFSYFPYGGLEQDMLKILRACQRRNVKVTIYCMQWEGEIPSNTKVILAVLSIRHWRKLSMTMT